MMRFLIAVFSAFVAVSAYALIPSPAPVLFYWAAGGAALPDPIIQYQFPEGSGSTTDNSGSGGATYDGTVNGTPTWASYNSNYSLQFDSAANTDQVTVDVDGTTLTSLTIGGCVNIGAANTNADDIFRWYQNTYSSTPFLLIQENGSGGLKVYVDGNYRMTATTSTSTWYSVFLVLDENSGDDWFLYLNGSQVDTYADTEDHANQSRALMINFGSSQSKPSHALENDMRLYDIALSPAQIATITCP